MSMNNHITWVGQS